jgi:uncharacterized protein YcbX
MSIVVESLHTYPVKSCAGIELDTATFTEYGIEADRQRIIVDAKNGRMITQRIEPSLALVETSLTDDVVGIIIPKVGQIALDPERELYKNNKISSVDVFKKLGTGVDQNDKVADLLSDFLKRPVRVLLSEQAREVNSRYHRPGASDKLGFADGFPELLTSSSSLAQLNRQLIKRGEKPVPMSRFRSNIVVGGENLIAFDEDYWLEVKIGELSAFVVRACARCPIPNIANKILRWSMLKETS